MKIHIGNEELAELLLSMDSEEALERLQGTAPAGFTPASGSRTRVAGRKPDASLTSDSAPPFPDQATGELQRLIHEWREAAAAHGSMASGLRKAYGSNDAATCQEKQAAVYRQCCRDLMAVLCSEPRAQSDSEEVEEAGCLELDDGLVVCQSTGLPVRRCSDCPSRGKRTERSGSGNAEVCHGANNQKGNDNEENQ